MGEKGGRTEKTGRFSEAEFFVYEEHTCVQCMHIGAYDDEPETLRKMERFVMEEGYQMDLTQNRLHHEIYLSDPRRTAPEKLKTVIRQPVRKAEENRKQ